MFVIFRKKDRRFSDAIMTVSYLESANRMTGAFYWSGIIKPVEAHCGTRARVEDTFIFNQMESNRLHWQRL